MAHLFEPQARRAATRASQATSWPAPHGPRFFGFSSVLDYALLGVPEKWVELEFSKQI